MPPLLVTLFVVAVVIGLPLIVGAVACRLLVWNDAFSERDWIDAPFVGGAIIIVALLGPFYAGVPLRVTVWPFLAIVVAAAVWIAARGRGRLREMRSTLPVAPFGVAVAAYLWQGLGLLILGSDRYLGRAWADQFNYLTIAEFVTHYGFHQPITSTSPPLVQVASQFVALRLGQSALHACFALVSGLPTRALFEPTILWSIFLMTLAVYALAQAAGLSRRRALIAATTAGVMPSLAYVQLESFLSQSLGGPHVLYFAACCYYARRTGRTRDFVVAALVLTGLIAIYFEFVPLAMLCVVALAGSYVGAGRDEIGGLRRMLLLAVPVGLYLAYGKRILVVMVSGVLGHIYPWAYSVEGVERLWIGDLVTLAAVRDSPIVWGLAVGVTVLGYAGLIVHALAQAARAWRGEKGWRPALLLACLMLGLASTPLAIFLRGPHFGYQLYKLELTASPLFVIGLALLFRRFAAVVCAGLAMPAAWATCQMAMASTVWSPITGVPPRHEFAAWLRRPEIEYAKGALENLSGRDVLLCATDEHGGVLNGWFSYYLRHNRTWLLSPQLANTDLRTTVGLGRLPPIPSTLPERTLIVATDKGHAWAIGSNRPRADGFTPVLIAPMPAGPFALVCHLGIARSGGPDSTTVDALRPNNHELVVFSSAATEATLVWRGADTRAQRAIDQASLVVNAAPAAHSVAADGVHVYTFPLRPGVNLLDVQAAAFDDFTQPPFTMIDMRMLLLGGDWMEIGAIHNPNGIEGVFGAPVIWLGGAAARIELLAGRAGTASVTFSISPGPSVAGPPTHLRVSTDEGYETTIQSTGGPVSLRIPVSRGRHVLTMMPLDAATMRIASDARPLVAQVRDLRAVLEPAAAAPVDSVAASARR